MDPKAKKAELDLLLRDITLQIDKIKAAGLHVETNSYGVVRICGNNWFEERTFTDNKKQYLSYNAERAELERTMLSLQKNLVKLRRAMY